MTNRVTMAGEMNYLAVAGLGGGCAAMLLAERLGLPTTLNLRFKSDLKREARWLAQYGQASCTLVAAILVHRLDPHRPHAWAAVVLAVVAAAAASTLAKRLAGRVRPGHELAGQFLGPLLRHDPARESFPSSHSAAAVALTVILARLYPPAAPLFWTLAVVCAALRYLMDAHWPSDVLGGMALGYVCGHVVCALAGL